MSSTKRTVFQKGQSGNPNGRPRGARNKVNALLRDRINDFLGDNFETLSKDIMELPIRDRIKCMMDLIPYVVAREVAGEVDLSKLTDEQLDRLAEHLVNKQKQ
jgi:hypothetical protein